jgi:hypothetical protein
MNEHTETAVQPTEQADFIEVVDNDQQMLAWFNINNGC